jgi:hypothetical protein
MGDEAGNYLVYVYSRTHDIEYFSPLDSNEHVDADMDTDEFEAILHDSIDSVCREELGVAYVEKAYKKANVMLIMLNLTDVERIRMDGFIFAHEFTDVYGHPAIDLDVVCAKKFGGLLLQKCIRLCHTLGSYRYIELSALPNVIGFYTRFGFRFRGNCNPRYGADYMITPELSDRLRRADNYAEDPIIARTLYSLHRLGYTPLTNPRACYDTTLLSHEYFAHRCHANGLEMRLCLMEDTAEKVVPEGKAAAKRATAVRKLDTMIADGERVIQKLYESGRLDTSNGEDTRQRIVQLGRSLRRERAQLLGEEYSETKYNTNTNTNTSRRTNTNSNSD